MAKQTAIERDGTIIEALSNAMFRVELDNGHILTAHISGKMRRRKVQICQRGDRSAVHLFRERRADVVGSQSRLHVRNRNSAIESRQSARKCACGIPLHDHEIGAQTFQCGVQCSEQMSHHRRSSRLRGRRR